MPINPIALLPVFWFLGLAPVFSFSVGAYLALWLRSGRRVGKYCAYASAAFCAYSAVYLFSILYNTELTIDERALGGFYNLALIVSAVPILIGAKNLLLPKNVAVVQRVGDFSAGLLVLAFVIGAPLVYLFEEQSLVVLPSLVGTVINVEALPPLARDSMSLLIVAPDWGGEEVIGRLTIFAPYANALAGLAVVLMGLSYRASNRFVVLAVIFGLLLALLTRSRIGIACSAIVFLLFFLTVLLKRRLLGIGLLGVAIFATIALGVYASGLEDGPKGISREASDHLRGVLYYESIVRAMESEPLIGLGVKPRLESYEMPLGSHSAFIGSFYKTGVVGFTFFLSGFLVIFFRGASLVIKGFQRRDPRLSLAGGTLASMFFFFFLEDVDAPQFLLTSFFLLSGLILNDRSGGLDESACDNTKAA